MRITDVRMRVFPLARSWLTERVIANPMSVYPEYKERRSSWYRTQSAGVIEVEVEDGTVGQGFVGSGKATASKAILEEQVRDLVVGNSCFATELIEDQLRRATSFFSGGGVTAALLSGIDIALWDVKGKVLDKPVYELLGGPTVAALRPYLTSFDAASMERFGVRDVKIAAPYGPADGEEGVRANVDAVAAAREMIGDDGMLAIDCYMAWDVGYAIEMSRRIADYRVAWIEEPVTPNDFEGYRRISESVDIRVSGGEHLYSLRDFQQLIERGLVDLVQPDIYRAGGPTALKKIAALAQASHRKLMCHGVGLATFHFMMSMPPATSPRCEYLEILDESEAPWVFSNEPVPSDGLLQIPDSPGFGLTLNEEALNSDGVAPIW